MPEKTHGEQLSMGAVCTYGEFLASGCEDGLVFDFIPKLVALCLSADNKSGRTLSEKEFLGIRDKAAGLVVPFDARQKAWIENYPDIRDYQDYRAASFTARQRVRQSDASGNN